MKLTVLTENTASDGFLAEHGLSYLIEHNGTKLLFDTGHSDIFLKNAEHLNIDLSDVEIVVLSHGHWDHGNGLKHLKNKTLICHPYAFIKRYRKSDSTFVGLNLNFKDLNKKFKLINTRKPYYITEDIIFLGEIPRLNSFESKITSYIDCHEKDDLIPDDSALVFIQNNELVIVSGCAHSGICNITEYAKKISKIKNIKAIIGGFHLKTNDAQTKKTIRYFEDQELGGIYPSHCTGMLVIKEFQKKFNTKQVSAGMEFKF